MWFTPQVWHVSRLSHRDAGRSITQPLPPARTCCWASLSSLLANPSCCSRETISGGDTALPDCLPMSPSELEKETTPAHSKAMVHSKPKHQAFDD